nr:hypothetical protein [Tanacetum cinerariifolium]
FVADETKKVDKYVNGLPNNIYGSVKVSKPKTLDEIIELANDLMDQKLRTYVERQSNNKIKADESFRNNHGHQQRTLKRQIVARVYNMGTGERKPVTITLLFKVVDPTLGNNKCLKTHSEMDQPNPTFAKILILDTGKFKQWKFRIQQYLQNEHYALWEVIEFGDSYKAPQKETGKGPASESSAKKKGRTVVITTEDIQKMRNDFKARTTLLLALLDEHHLRFSNEKGEVHTASTQVSTASTDVAAASISQDTVCAYIASQLNGSQIKYEDITQIDEDDIKEMDIKWNMALLSMRADRPTPSIYSSKSNTSNLQNSNLSVFEHGESSSSIMSKPMIKFVKAADCPEVIKTNKTETARKSPVKYAEIGCSRHMTGNLSYLSEYEPYDGGYVSFGYGGGKITGKGIIKTGKLEFENVYFVKELKYNLFSMSQICDDKNNVLFTDSECIVLGKDFKLKDDTNVLLRTPGQHNMYSIDLNNVVPHKNLTCLVAKASVDESMLWHRRLCHLNFKTMNKLVRHNLVKGLPSKCFENDHTCVVCLKEKQYKASCKTKLVNSVSKPLHTLHMDLFGPTSVSSLNHKWYCLVVTDDFLRFTWTFFLRTKNETSGILRNFITEIENLKDLKVKIISNARTPQQNRVAERRNRTLIEAARTMLADAKLPVTFWAEAVTTACYVQNRVLVNKSQNKTPYELFNSRTPAIGFLRPFRCHVVILNTLDHLGKSDAKGDEDFLENKLIEKGAGPNWLFDIDTLTNSMNYVPVVVAGTSSTNISGTKDVASQDVKKDVSSLRYIALPNWFHEDHLDTRNCDASDGCNADVPENSGISNPTASSKVPPADQVEPAVSITVESKIPTVSSPVSTVSLDNLPKSSNGPRLITKGDFSQQETPSLSNALTLSNRFEDTIRVEADLSNIESSIPASPIPTFRIHKDHPKSQIIGPVDTSEEPKKIFDALKDLSWVEAMQEELFQFKIQNIWILVDCPKGEEGIDYEEVFAPVARIEAIRLFLAYASFIGFVVYQMYVKSAFLYGTIDEEVYVMQPPGFQDPEFPDRVYKVEKAMYGLHQAPRAWYGEFLLVQVYVDDIIFGSSNPQLCREFEALMHDKFQMSAMDVRSVNIPIDKENLWGKDRPGKDVELHLYRSMIRSLMYLTASRPDIIDYGGATQDRKSTTGGCQFLGRRLILWQCKKQTIVATSTTEAEYVAAASGCG